MNTTIQNNSRTTHLLALMKKGDDAFNTRNIERMKAVHHPDMIAHIAGNPEPVFGEPSHAALMKQMFSIFPDSMSITTHTPFSLEAATGSP